MILLKIVAVINQPIWLIEENARSFRRDVWLRPLILPIAAESIINGITIQLKIE